ncbi:MAG: 3-keto-5-aminohexanoate cleavage protein [Propionibacteriaceae bacterium]|jgi:uncharacterized protein (DUF849 family)|nr:3-keto-5-aminohexanoate cleavage protein [Propionibacteriaceae bacterium]
MSLENKVILTCALTGAITPKSVNEHIPMTPEEIAQDAYDCWQAGASVVHLHMRDDEGLGTMDAARFVKTIELLKAHPDCDVVINLTTGGDSRATDEERYAHLPLILPEIGSYDAGSFNWMPDGVFVNSPKFLETLGAVERELNIKPELEIFDLGHIGITEYYARKGILDTPLHYQFVLGVPGGLDTSIDTLLFLKNRIQPGSTWGAFGIGRAHLPIMYATLAMGGHVRVGLEDNVYYSQGRKATNVQLVERAVRVIGEFGKEVATPDEAREILGTANIGLAR